MVKDQIDHTGKFTKRSTTALTKVDEGLLLSEVYDNILKGNVRSSVTSPFRKDRGRINQKETLQKGKSKSKSLLPQSRQYKRRSPASSRGPPPSVRRPLPFVRGRVIKELFKSSFLELVFWDYVHDHLTRLWDLCQE